MHFKLVCGTSRERALRNKIQVMLDWSRVLCSCIFCAYHWDPTAVTYLQAIVLLADHIINKTQNKHSEFFVYRFHFISYIKICTIFTQNRFYFCQTRFSSMQTRTNFHLELLWISNETCSKLVTKIHPHWKIMQFCRYYYTSNYAHS